MAWSGRAQKVRYLKMNGVGENYEHYTTKRMVLGALYFFSHRTPNEMPNSHLGHSFVHFLLHQ